MVEYRVYDSYFQMVVIVTQDMDYAEEVCGRWNDKSPCGERCRILAKVL